ncbi:hypothetical protein GCM10011574_60310 [Microbispora bryophytorum]|uniref:Uncharacterized protein n=1 Tax=Microbispora bryophytorum TaxID=1460882 RepID=A0A8H9H5A4_9ACTN|nr:hypothetical protein FLX07_27350 [Microbispora bryophytorum]GGO27170.1 hypothetical protein GCM10011574_60310 [Microbispora bryophytorum]
MLALLGAQGAADVPAAPRGPECCLDSSSGSYSPTCPHHTSIRALVDCCGTSTRFGSVPGLETSRFHDIRYTAVSLLLDLGVPPHVIREIVGDSAIEVTNGRV